MAVTNQGLKFFYGDFIHEVGETWPQSIEYRRRKTDRGLSYATDVRFEIGIEAKLPEGTAVTQANMDARVGAIEDAYTFDYKDAGFLLNDGSTISEHYLQSNAALNLTGNRVKNLFFHNRHPTEHFNIRTGTVVIEATFESTYSDILDMRETLEYRGSTEPELIFRPKWDGDRYDDVIYQKGKLTLVQSGYVKYKDTPGGFATISTPQPWFPANEMKRYRRIKRISGIPWGNLHGERFHSRVLQYRYVMNLSNFTSYEPNTYTTI